MADNNNRNQRDHYNQEWNDKSNQWNRERRNRAQQELGDYGNANRENYNRNEAGRDYHNMSGGYDSGYGQMGDYNRRDDDNWQYGSRGNYDPESNWQRSRGNYEGGLKDDFARQYGKSEGYDSQYNRSMWNNYQGNRGYESRDQQDRDLGRDKWDITRGGRSSWLGSDDGEKKLGSDRMGGSHRGKGPKDYQRSEKRILEDVCDRLSDDDELDASNIQVHVQNSEVILTGTVENRKQKRRAEDLVDSISGVKHVENRIRVGHSSDFGAHQYTGTTNQIGGIGDESGTTSEIIRNVRNKE